MIKECVIPVAWECFDLLVEFEYLKEARQEFERAAAAHGKGVSKERLLAAVQDLGEEGARKWLQEAVSKKLII